MLYEATERLRFQPGHNVSGSAVEGIEEADAGWVACNVRVVGIEVAEGSKSRCAPRTVEGIKIIVRIGVTVGQQRPSRAASAGSGVERSELEIRGCGARGARDQRYAGGPGNAGTGAHHPGARDRIGRTHMATQAERLVIHGP